MSDPHTDEVPEPEAAPGASAGPEDGETGAAGDVEGETQAPATVEELIAALEATTSERDEYLDLARRTQAEFENHRKRVAKQQSDEVLRAAASLVEQLLPLGQECLVLKIKLVLKCVRLLRILVLLELEIYSETTKM